MPLDPSPPSLRRRLARATRGVRMAISGGVEKLFSHRLRPAETPAAGTLHRAAPAPTPRNGGGGLRDDKWAPETGLAVDACPVCGDPLAALVKDDYCPSCNTPARTRVLAPLLDEVIAPLVRQGIPTELPLLGFAMAGVERKLLAPLFPHVRSVSLFGEYGRDHDLGVDARDLGRYPDAGFCAHFSILLFDYFVEQDQALAEAWRVLAPGGLFLTQFNPGRLVDGWTAPVQVKEVRRRPGYFEYLPEGVALADIKVGRQWFLQAMQDKGFSVRWVRVRDRAAGKALDWFVGRKPPEPHSAAFSD